MFDTSSDVIDLRDAAEVVREGVAVRTDLDEGEREDLRAAIRFVRAFISDGLASDFASFEDYAENEPTCVAERYWTTYAQELAEEVGVGALPEGNHWPSYCIDWEWAARELAHDYSRFEHDGTTYYVRSF
jgi:hypothetical protein